MGETYNNRRVFEDGKSYRVWSLTGQGFLKLTTKNGGTSVEYSVTKEEESSKITAKEIYAGDKMGYRLEFQEDGKKYALHADTDNDTVSSLPEPWLEGKSPTMFHVQRFGGKTFQALMVLGTNREEKKCVAISNSEKKWSLKTFDYDKPDPDTMFIITKVKRIMSETYNNRTVFEDGKSYRVWSLTGQGFLKLTTKNGGKSVEYSVTKEEESSKITAKEIYAGDKMGYRLEFQEDGKKYALHADTDNDTVSSLPEPWLEGKRPTMFHIQRFSGESFKALMALGPNREEKKCVAISNSEKKWSLKAFDNDIPHPDTMFLITKV